jgi:putative transposase
LRCTGPGKALSKPGRPRRNTAAIQHYNQTHNIAIVIRHSKDLNNVVEQDHRAVKRLTRPMLEFKSFWATRCTIAGIEVMHAIRKGQLRTSDHSSPTPAEQFYALAA